MKIVGFSGSPTKSGVLETAMTKVLESTNHEWELIRLSRKKIKFCSGCVGCAATNQCVIRDDMDELIEKIMEADAIVLGGITRHNGLNALMKNFIERLSPLFHRKMLLQNKPTAIVSSGLASAQEGYNDLSEFVKTFRMKEIGSLLTGGNASCYKCGYGESCAFSAHTAINGNVKITEDTFYHFEQDSECVKQAIELGEKIAQVIQ